MRLLTVASAATPVSHAASAIGEPGVVAASTDVAIAPIAIWANPIAADAAPAVDTRSSAAVRRTRPRPRDRPRQRHGARARSDHGRLAPAPSAGLALGGLSQENPCPARVENFLNGQDLRATRLP
jgi:hypothetical protein